VGLTTPQAEELLRQHGYNEVKAKQTPEWKKIAWRYLDWVCLIIIAAAVVSVAIENNGSRGWLSFTLLIIELNLIVWVGYYTERNAGNAIKELEELAAPQAMVCRDGRWQELPVRELVPGDLVALKGGDVIPADCEVSGFGGWGEGG
jgi:H+-transporting ATPase